MALAINTIDGRELSNEVTAKEKQDTAICRSFHSKSHLMSCTLLTRWSASVLKVGMLCEASKRRLVIKSLIIKVLEYKAEELNLYALLCVP